MIFKRGDRVKNKEGKSAWYVERVTADGSKVYCRSIMTGKGEPEKQCFMKEELELIKDRLS